jgi:hypothetical protein
MLKNKTPPILRVSATTDTVGRTQRAHTKWNTTNHDITMFGMGWSRQALGEGVSNHEIGAKRNEFENLLCDQVTHKVAANINMTRVFTTDRVFGHSHTTKIVFIDPCGSGRGKTKIT